jgi:hypothetical protein
MEPDQAQKLGPLAAKLASMLYCTLAVRTAPQPGTNPPQFAISGLASGVGTNVQGRDIIISSDTQAQLGANLGFIARIVLSRTEEEVANYRLMAHSPRLAVVDCPTAIHVDGRHRKMNLRYVLLVDPRNGRVHSLLWPLVLDEQNRWVPGTAPPRWLSPNLIHDYPLFVDSNHVYAGVPTSAALAMGRLPDGFPLAPNSPLQQLIAAPNFTADSMQQIEQMLWPLLAQTARAQQRPAASSPAPAPPTALVSQPTQPRTLYPAPSRPIQASATALVTQPSQPGAVYPAPSRPVQASATAIVTQPARPQPRYPAATQQPPTQLAPARLGPPQTFTAPRPAPPQRSVPLAPRTSQPILR